MKLPACLKLKLFTVESTLRDRWTLELCLLCCVSLSDALRFGSEATVTTTWNRECLDAEVVFRKLPGYVVCEQSTVPLMELV